MLLNLSHEKSFRTLLIHSSLIGKLASLLEHNIQTELVIPLLYQLTLDEKQRSYPAFSDCLPTLLQNILDSRKEKLSLPLIALAINLANDRHNAQLFCVDNQFSLLLKKAFKTQDPLLFKLMRVLLEHNPTQEFVVAVSFPYHL